MSQNSFEKPKKLHAIFRSAANIRDLIDRENSKRAYIQKITNEKDELINQAKQELEIIRTAIKNNIEEYKGLIDEEYQEIFQPHTPIQEY